MVCFFACFGACKHRKRRHLVNATQSEDRGYEVTEALKLVESAKQEVTATEKQKPLAESKGKLEELSSCNTKKKATFDLNVETHEELANEEVIDNLVKNSEKKEVDDLVENSDKKKEVDDLVENSDKKKECDDLVGNSDKKKERDDLVNNSDKKESDDSVKIIEEKGGDDLVKTNENINIASEKEEKTPKAVKLVSDAKAITPSHRYQNCETIEDEYEELDLDLEESDLKDGEGNDDVGSDEQMLVQEVSSESLFSLSIESRKQVCEVELGEKEVNSPMPNCGGIDNQELEEIGFNGNARDRSQYVHSVLNPVENLAQWKAIKGRAIPPSKYQEKENMNLVQDLDMPICQEPSFKLLKLNSNSKKVMDGAITVESSLSSWLVESETTPMSKTSTISIGNSPRTCEDKPILRAVTDKEVNQLSAPTYVISPRGSRRYRSRKEPEIGTVGSYWSHTGKIVDSDSGSSSQGMPKTRCINSEDEKVKWHSTPLQARLESWVEF